MRPVSKKGSRLQIELRYSECHRELRVTGQRVGLPVILISGVRAARAKNSSAAHVRLRAMSIRIVRDTAARRKLGISVSRLGFRRITSSRGYPARFVERLERRGLAGFSCGFDTGCIKRESLRFTCGSRDIDYRMDF